MQPSTHTLQRTGTPPSTELPRMSQQDPGRTETALTLFRASKEKPLPEPPSSEKKEAEFAGQKEAKFGEKKEAKFADVKIPRNELGIKVLREPKDVEEIDVDIVAVHGIAVKPGETWKYVNERDPQDKSKVLKATNWLSDPTMLPAVAPTARVMAFGYDSVWYGTAPSKNTLGGVADEMLHALKSKRKDCLNRPIIFVGHCFGGLVMEQAYVTAQFHPQDFPGIYESITGMIFLGTPHQGTSSVNLGTPGAIFKAAVQARYRVHDGLLNSIAHDNSTLVKTVYDFTRNISLRNPPPKLFCFFEKRETPVGKIANMDLPLEFIVNETSGSLNGHQKLGLDLNHFEMNKFENSEDNNYERVVEEILGMVKEAKQIMAGRSETMQIPSHSTHPHPNGLAQKSVPMLPYPIAAGFAPRDGILEKIKHKFDDSSRVALVGCSGTGKSHIAVEYADYFLKGNSGAKIYWVNASNATEFQSSYEAIGRDQRIRVQKGDNIMTAVQHCLKHDASGNWLMILDGVGLGDEAAEKKEAPKEQTSAVASVQSLLQYIPTGHPYGGSVLVTTRSGQLASRVVNHNPSYIVEVPARLSEDDSVQLLYGGKQPKSTTTRKHLVKISDVLGRLAGSLALAQAYKRTSVPDITWEGISNLVQDSATKSEVLSTADAKLVDSNSVKTMASIWQPLYSKLKDSDAEAARLLRMLCFLDVQSLPLFLLDKLINSSQRKVKIKTLAKHDMLEWSVNEKDVRITPMVRLCVLAALGHSKDEAASVADEALALVCERYPSAESEDNWLTICKVLRPCAAAALRLNATSVGGTLKRADLLLKTAAFEKHVGQYQTAVQYFEEGLALHDRLEKHAGGNKKLIEEAKRSLEDARTMQRKSERRNSKLNGVSLATAPAQIKSIEKASRLEDVRKASNVTASLHRRDQASMSGNVKNYRQILEWCQDKYGTTHLDTGRQQYNLALSYAAQGEYSEAEKIYQEALKTMEQVHGQAVPNPDSLRIKGMLGVMYCDQNRLADADATFQDVLKGQKECLGLDHPETLVTRLNAANVAQELRPQDLDSIATELKSVLTTQVRILGAETPDTLRTACGLALNYRRSGREKEAEALFRTILLSQGRALGAKNPDTVTTMVMLAELLEEEGKAKEARQTYTDALGYAREIWGEGHPDFKNIAGKILDH